MVPKESVKEEYYIHTYKLFATLCFSPKSKTHTLHAKWVKLKNALWPQTYVFYAMLFRHNCKVFEAYFFQRLAIKWWDKHNIPPWSDGKFCYLEKIGGSESNFDTMN